MPMTEEQCRKKREYMRAWRAAHPENANYQRKYNAAYTADPRNAVKARRRAREWYCANRERASARAKAAYAKKPKKGRPTGEKHPNWKGGAVCYAGLHAWIRKQLGTPRRCSLCGRTDARRYEWANRDHKYRRTLTDWFRACTSCHRRHDYEKGLSGKGGRRPL